MRIFRWPMALVIAAVLLGSIVMTGCYPNANVVINFASYADQNNTLKFGFNATTFGGSEGGNLEFVQDADTWGTLDALNPNLVRLPLRLQDPYPATPVLRSGPAGSDDTLDGIDWVDKIKDMNAKPHIVVMGQNQTNDGWGVYDPQTIYAHLAANNERADTWSFGNEPNFPKINLATEMDDYCNKWGIAYDNLMLAVQYFSAPIPEIYGPELAQYDNEVLQAFIENPNCGGKGSNVQVSWHNYAMGESFINDPYPADGVDTTKNTDTWGTQISEIKNDTLAAYPARTNIRPYISEVGWTHRVNNGSNIDCDPEVEFPEDYDERLICDESMVFHAAIIGSVIQAGGRISVFGDLNGYPGLICDMEDGCDEIGLESGDTLPAYAGMQAFMNTADSPFTNPLIPAHTLSNVEIYASGSGVIVYINKGSSAQTAATDFVNFPSEFGDYDAYRVEKDGTSDHYVQVGSWSDGLSVNLPPMSVTVVRVYVDSQ